jgi:hypothetical protein
MAKKVKLPTEQAKHDASVRRLKDRGLLPDRDLTRLYRVGSDVKPMIKAQEFDLPPRGDPRSRAPLPQLKK